MRFGHAICQRHGSARARGDETAVGRRAEQLLVLLLLLQSEWRIYSCLEPKRIKKKDLRSRIVRAVGGAIYAERAKS